MLSWAELDSFWDQVDIHVYTFHRPSLRLTFLQIHEPITTTESRNIQEILCLDYMCRAGIFFGATELVGDS
jgi:hypothetical protein